MSTSAVPAPASARHPLMTGASIVVALGFLGGLAIRLVLLPYKGTLDMNTYLEWGHRTLDLGLPNAYSGIYFPGSFQLFGAIVRISEVSGLSEVAAIKAVNLAFDVGTFALILVLLRRWRAPLGYALLYWLSPFFLAIYWLGYVDAQLAFCLLAFIAVIEYSRGWMGDVAAGVPLAALVLLKPQGAIIVGSLALFVVVAAVRRRSSVAPAQRLALTLIAPVLLFVAYSVWIATSATHSAWYLSETVLETRSHMPALSANMLNGWAVVAELYRPSGHPIYVVEEPAAFHQVALVVTLALIVAAMAWLVPRAAGWGYSQRVLMAVAVGMTIYPMTATAAHENHLFIGLMCLGLVAGLLRCTRVTWLLSALLFVQFVNLFALYRFGVNDLTDDHFGWVLGLYPPGVRAALAAVAIVLWLGLAAALAAALRGRGGAQAV